MKPHGMMTAAAALMLAGLAPSALADAERPAAAIAIEQTVNGTIQGVDEQNMSFKVRAEDGSELQLQYNDKTAFTIDGEQARQGEVLERGNVVQVSHRSNVALSVAMESADAALIANISGKVRNVSEESFVLMTDEGEAVTVRLDENTEFALDGKPARKDQVLAKGNEVQVTHEDNLASKVEARSSDAAFAAFVTGKVRSVSEESFVLMTEDGEALTVQLNADTEFALDGKPARKDQVLAQGNEVRVTHEDNLASKVETRSEMAATVLATASGKVRSVSEESFVLMTDEGEALTVQLNADTEFALDGKPARKDQVLAQGNEVRVTHEDNLASKVEARSEMAATVLATASGKVRSVSEESFVLMTDEGEALTIRLDENTEFLLDGESARKNQVLAQGKQVQVTHEDNLASRVEARSSH